jgi:hypothetical protein
MKPEQDPPAGAATALVMCIWAVRGAPANAATTATPGTVDARPTAYPNPGDDPGESEQPGIGFSGGNRTRTGSSPE